MAISLDTWNTGETGDDFFAGYNANMAAIQAAINGLPVIEAGAVQLDSLAVGAEGTKAITFTKTFAENPSITLTPNAGGGRVQVGVTNNSKTGFTIAAKAIIAGQYWVHWVAVERK
jgi:hypothetical protein